MNILICSTGSRVKFVQYLKKALVNEGGGKVIAADWDKYSPSLYAADEGEVIPRVDEEGYIEAIADLCRKHEIAGIVPVLDEEVPMLAEHKDTFDELGVALVLSNRDMVEICCDKLKTYEYVKERSLPGVPTYNLLSEAQAGLERGELDFPLVVKPEDGKASQGVQVVETESELEEAVANDGEYIIQPHLKDREYGVDVYIDMNSGELVDLFVKEKFEMSGGATSKSISVRNDELEGLVRDFISQADFAGPIDIDCFEYNGKFYLSEVNPRFGAGYVHAYEAGCDFMTYIVRNLKEETNPSYQGSSYEDGIAMMKYTDVMLRRIE
ncbi:ATP-grasp domain-containing protein [Virgibacillus xinjiangensis]|uniref:ATP-grasp domain-containing protein n=1 Tax=Virgibacillus xinjiangensis TaxID=393090 RepID=A0ABV7CTW2_9BACI